MTDLPRHLDRDQLEQHARESTTLYEFTRRCRVGRQTAKEFISEYGLRDEVESVNANRM